MTITFSHVAVSVAEMDRSLRFYRDLLGFEVISDFTAEGDSVDNMVSLKGVKVRIALLRQNGSMLELCHYLSPEGRSDKTMRQCDPGITHFAFVTDRFDRIIGKLKSDGYELLSDPLNLGAIEGMGNVRAVYFHGPDREAIELLEVT